MDDKKGQLNISFGMIFSIILIVVFLAFAFYAIQKFLSFQHDATIAKFYEGLNNDVGKVWASTQASKEVEYNLPTSVVKVCFKNNPTKNIYLYEKIPLPDEYVDHLNIASPFCIPVANGKVKLLLEKSFGQAYVNISGA